MKGKLSRMCRSGLSMMLALIMMFSLATVAFATEGGVSIIANKYEVSEETVAKVQEAANTAVDFLRDWEALDGAYEAIANSETLKAKLNDVQAALDVVIAKAENTELVQEAIAAKNEINYLMGELDRLNGELEAAEAKLNSIIAKAEALGADPADIELLQNADLTNLDAAKIEELKAALERVMELEDEAGELKAEAEAAKADMEALEDEAEAMMDRVTALKNDLTDLAASVVATVKEAVVDLAKLAVVLKNMAEARYAGAEEYIYNSLQEQGFVSVVDAKVGKVITLLSDALANVEDNTTLSPEFKAELIASIKNAKASAVELKNAIASASNLKEAGSNLVSSAATLKTNLKDVVDLFNAGTGADLAVAKKYAVAAYEVGVEVAEILADMVKAAIYNATHAEIALPCDAKYVAMGDGSVSGYATLVASALSASLTDLSVQGEEAADGIAKVAANAAAIKAADIITVGYGLDGVTDFVADQMTLSDSINWSAIMADADVKLVDDALMAIRSELAKKLDTQVLELVMIAIESYAFGYAKYLVDYPMLVNDIHNLNPEALVVVVGVYNPLQGAVVSVDGTEIALGDYLNKVIDATGLYNLASAILLPNTIYVEAADVENSMDTSAAFSPAGLAVKLARGTKEMLPTAAGYAYIKNQIVNALTVTHLDHVWNDGVKIQETGLLKFAWKYTCVLCGAIKIVSDDLDHKAFMQGHDTGLFGADENMTRGQAAQMFFNMLDTETQGEYVYSEKFPDVGYCEYDENGKVVGDSTYWYARAVLRLAELGVLQGFEDGTFRPEEQVTRAQFAEMAVKITGVSTSGATENFPDVAEADWFYKSVATSAMYGWVCGYEDGTFLPNRSISRAEAAKIADCMLGRPVGQAYDEFFATYLPTGMIPVDRDGNMGEMKVLPDIEGHWAINWVLEATVSHYHKLFG